MLKDSGRLDDAEACYRDVLQHEPYDFDAAVQLGRTLVLLGEYPSAQAHYLTMAEALSDAPQVPQRTRQDLLNEMWQLADRLRDAKRPRSAALMYEAIRHLSPDDDAAALQHGNMLKDIGEYRASTETYLSVIARHPENRDALLELGRVLALQGRSAEAKAVFESALARGPATADLEDEHRRTMSSLTASSEAADVLAPPPRAKETP